MPHFEENELITRISNGDEDAFRLLFNQWHQVLAGFIFRMTRSKEITEEIVQDVFLKIWMVRESLPEIQNFKHYLLVVARNQAYDALKKKLKEEALKQQSTAALSDLPTPVENEFLSSWQQAIDMAINKLPERRKQVYLLSRHEGLSYHEIGEKLGISRESVKTHLKLASRSISMFMQSKKHELITLCILFSKLF